MMLIAGTAAGCSTSKDSANVSPQEMAASSGNSASSTQFAAADMAVGGEMAEAGSVAGAGAPPAATNTNASAGGNEASATAVTTGNQAQAGVASSPDGLNRKIIYKANMTMETEKYDDAQTQVRNLVTLQGGYIVQFAEGQSGSEKYGNFTIRVPAAGFSSFLEGIEDIPHKKLQRSMQGEDVSEQYVDLESRLKAKEAAEQRLLAFMEKAVKSEELVAFSNELGLVQTEIEQIKGKMRYLDQNVAYSTVELRLYQKVQSAAKAQDEEEPLSDRMGRAIGRSADVLVKVMEGVLIALAALLPVLMAVILIGGPFVWWRLRVRRQRAQRPIAGEVGGGAKPEADDEAPKTPYDPR